MHTEWTECNDNLKLCIHKRVICVRRISSAQLINFHKPEASRGHPAHPVLFVFTQKSDKFWFTANGMRTVCGWRSAGLQSHPHIHTFGSQTICEPFGMLVSANHSARSCLRGLRVQPYNTFVIGCFPSCLRVLALGNMHPLSVHIT